MTFEAFQAYIKENVLKEWREDADIEMAVVRKNNGIELCGLYIRREEEQISPTIYLDEYYSYYLKGEESGKNMSGRYPGWRIIILIWRSLSM